MVSSIFRGSYLAEEFLEFFCFFFPSRPSAVENPTLCSVLKPFIWHMPWHWLQHLCTAVWFHMWSLSALSILLFIFPPPFWNTAGCQPSLIAFFFSSSLCLKRVCGIEIGFCQGKENGNHHSHDTRYCSIFSLYQSHYGGQNWLWLLNNLGLVCKMGGL